MRGVWVGLQQTAHYTFALIFFIFSYLLRLWDLIAPLLGKRRRREKEVVIIGGGFAGALVAKALQRGFRVTLIDNKDYFECTPSVLRTVVEPHHLSAIQVRHRSYLNDKKSKVVLDSVVGVMSDHVLTSKGEIGFDYLVLCPGSTYGKPFKESSAVLANRGDLLSNCWQDLSAAKVVLIIGGGIVGVELAAEVAERFSNKEIILVHAGPHLMDGRGTVPAKASNYARSWLEDKGVRIIYNERVVRFGTKEDPRFVTNKGTVIETEMAFLSTGSIPNSTFLRDGMLAPALDSKGFIVTNAHLQLKHHPNIFACGDVLAMPEEKLAQAAEKHAVVVTTNIRLLERNQVKADEFKGKAKESRTSPRRHSKDPEAIPVTDTAKQPLKLASYEPADLPILISLGKYAGMFVWKGWALNGFLPAVLKEFVEWKILAPYK